MAVLLRDRLKNAGQKAVFARSWPSDPRRKDYITVLVNAAKPRLLLGVPHYNRASWFEVGKGYTFRKARRCSLGGSGTAAAMALRAACSGL